MTEETLEFETQNSNSLILLINKIWERIKYLFFLAEPFIVRFINMLFFELTRLIKNFSRYAMRQIKLED